MILWGGFGRSKQFDALNVGSNYLFAVSHPGHIPYQNNGGMSAVRGFLAVPTGTEDQVIKTHLEALSNFRIRK